MYSTYSLPSLVNISIANDSNTRCFSSVIFNDFGTAVIDCAEKKSGIVPRWDNYFYYVNLYNKTITKVYSDTFGVFSDISKRKMIKYRQPDTGLTYFIRTYLATGVDKEHADNTYI